MSASGIETLIDSMKTGDKFEEKLVDLAKLCETAERYEDMCTVMEALVRKRQKLEEPERNLLSVAFKNVVGARRASWRTITADDTDVPPELIAKYKQRIEQELNDVCKQVLDLLSDVLVTNVDGGDHTSRVFYGKMQGDYHRYLAEILSDKDALERAAKNAQSNYETAMDVAKEHLPETDPTRLGLALNLSVCYYEILKMTDDACKLAKDAFDGAIQKLDSLQDASYKDSTLIMQLLRDNLTLWTSENEDQQTE